MIIPTYPEPAKEKLPQYCENRCHQRTSGRVYPNAIVKEVVRDHKIDKEYTAIVLENDFIELIILPELGGRIFGARDKTNNYDFFYRQHVIKPALIGMLGSWISGGAEFNWPMHHRPSTFLPVDFSIENADDGSVTVWLSEHEPMDRMKGMVGIKVSPDKAMFETRARVFNRTELPQTFLWWENIGVPVNENYQIFFPQDVNHVHFHRKQSVAGYPMAGGVMFNGKDYRHGERDIRRHKNTREATSYFSAPSNYDFFGGFDHGRKAGVVHVANHHISPGKKLFTWSYGQLAESWENALTDTDGAYAELMAGVYSDNQPDFSWLEAGEVKQFSQFWYPIKELGEPLNANAQVAIKFSLAEGRIWIYAVEDLKNVTIEISDQGKCVDIIKTDLAISKTTVIHSENLKQCSSETVKVRLLGADGKEIISFCRAELKPPVIPSPRPADPSPLSLDNPDELYLVGLHMKQYRDALTKPDVYWQRAIEINPMHYQSLIGLGLSALKDFRLKDAENYFRKAIDILTKYNPNPREGEAYYGLGLALKWQNQFDGAYDAFYKSIWNYRWRSQGYYELATIDCLRQDFVTAKTHLFEALDAYAGNQKARNLLAVVERRLGHSAKEILAQTLRLDSLDYWALNEAGKDFFGMMSSDPSQTILDVVFEYTGAGLFDEAVDLLKRFTAKMNSVSPMILYTFGWTLEKLGFNDEAVKFYSKASAASPDYCFPSRLEEMRVLQQVVNSRRDTRAAYYLGNLLYGKEHYDEAITQWENALRGGEKYYVLYRNLGMASYNNRCNNAEAIKFMQQAMAINLDDPQLIFEFNLLLQLANVPVAERIRMLESHMLLVERRDDLYLELVRAYNEQGDCKKAIKLLQSHTFTPCEGGEHAILEQYIFAHFKLGREALREGKYEEALSYFRNGQTFSKNLGAGVWNIAMKIPCMYYEAKALDHIDENKAKDIYRFIADMGIDLFSYMYQPSMDYYRAMTFERLGEKAKAKTLLENAVAEWAKKKAEKDYGYFQLTPFFLSFLQRSADTRQVHYGYLLGLGYLGLGDRQRAKECFENVLAINSGHLLAAMEKSFIR
jgi:tetratricopeptide (TPR) repeat protein